MTIVTSEIIAKRRQANDTWKIKEKHTDHLGVEWFYGYYYLKITVSGDPPVEHPTDAEINVIMLSHIPELEAQAAEQEIFEAVAQMEKGLDPLHSSPFVQNVPDYQTWDEWARGVWIVFLAREGMNELSKIELSFNNTSSNDIKSVLGITQQILSDIQGDIQIAIDLQTKLSAYTPYYPDIVM